MSNSPIIFSNELKDILTKVVLIDVREPFEHETGIIPGAKLIPLGSLGYLAEKELSQLDPNSPIVTYCAHGIRSLYAIQILDKFGFSNVRSLDGGIEAWHSENGPIVNPA